MAIWKNKLSLAVMNAGFEQTLVRHLGIEVTEIGDDYVKAKMPVDQRTHQPFGLLHGGASVALAETMGSMAGQMCVELGHTTVLDTRFACALQPAREPAARAEDLPWPPLF